MKRIETMNVSNQSKKEKVTSSNEKEKYSKTNQKETGNVERIEIMTASSKSEKERVTNSSEKEIENHKENKCSNTNEKPKRKISTSVRVEPTNAACAPSTATSDVLNQFNHRGICGLNPHRIQNIYMDYVSTVVEKDKCRRYR